MSDMTNAEGPKGWPYHGQALAIRRSAKRPGRLAQQAASLGLHAASLTLPVVRQPTPVQKPKRPVPRPRHRGSAKRRRYAGRAALVGLGGGPAGLGVLAITALVTRWRDQRARVKQTNQRDPRRSAR